MTVELKDIQAAAAAIRGQVNETPCLHSRTLSEIIGAEVYLKFENHQFTASFKERGALNKLMSLTPEQAAKGVIACSAGNHAQGVAYHAHRLGIHAVIVMPRHTPFVKVEHTQRHGAEVILHPTLTDTIDRDVELAIVRATAAQNQCYVFGINGFGDGGNGRSIICGPAGEVLYQGESAAEMIPLESDCCSPKGLPIAATG